ncbi:hypothetical protein ACPX19_08820 [Winogradskyella sp. HB-48]|uniref:hypothetical protein n=1 Tax=Winogradskyella sp. HB-48 TaxID=3416808 RepID=UPI003CEC47AA
MRNITLLLALVILNSTLIAQNSTCKCCTEKHSEFDFWVGTWEVTNPNGTKAGENTIEKIQDGCVLQENWTSAMAGFTGTSNNFYNYKTKQWEQIWIDNQGHTLHIKGNKVANQMILQTEEAINSEGKTVYHRITWTENEDGTVRQLWETIIDGKNVTVAFDGLYKPKS